MSRFSIREETSICRFGIPVLDESIGGGLPRGSIILVEDEVGVNSDPLLIQFLAEGLASGEYGYIMGTEHLYDHYRQLLIPFGIDEIVVETRRLVHLDAFTSPFGGGKERRAMVRGPTNVINDLFSPRETCDKIMQALLHVRSAPVRGVIDSLSTLMSVSDNLRAPFAFFQHKIALDKKNRHVTLYTVHSDVHDHSAVKALEHYCDAVFKIYKVENQSYLKVIKIEGQHSLEITEFLYQTSPGRIVLEPVR
ncbi:MAG: RAD55 family ATPase [Candidatus Hodarchaeales archaeon]|jgi:KaiC/GvpD/RAD55 family RecA-like ATPase